MPEHPRESTTGPKCDWCEGEGYVEDVDDYSAPWIECEQCEGTGDRFGRGPTKPNPREFGASRRSRDTPNGAS